MSVDRSARLKNLSAEQRAQLLQTLRAGNMATNEAAIIPRRARHKAPLSYAQQRLWFLDQLEPGSSSFNVPVAFRMKGDLPVAVLTRVLNEIVRRHEALRTAFAVENEQPVQHVGAQMKLDLPVIDLSALPQEVQTQEVKRLATTEALRPFDLARGPLFRVQLLRLHAKEHVLVATGHHIVFDGWSWGVFMQEFAALYAAFAEDKKSPLAELPLQYADFAAWQRETLAGAALERELFYWKEQLAGAPSQLELPRDRAQTAEQRLRGAFHAFKLPPDLTRALRDLCRREGVTLYMLLLAAFKTLLHRYSGQNDLVVGSPFANRMHAELEGLIGCFMNPLPLRTNLEGDPSFRELMQRVRDIALNAATHQIVPFDLLVQAVQPVRDLKTPPLFQALFLLQNFPWKPLELPGLTVELLLEISTELMYPVALIMAEEEDALIGQLEYAAGDYEQTLARLPQHFETLLRGLVANPELRLSQAPLLTEPEREQILFEWNDTRKDFSSEKCVQELVEAQVEATPEAVALVAGERQLTYAELNRRATQLARKLQELGVGPEVRVGICCERSPEMIIGLLGILKAGGAYVPLDPNYPEERLRFMMDDARIAVLLTQKEVVNRGSWIVNDGSWIEEGGVLLVDCRSQHEQRSTSHELQANPDNLAYVIYTSGSTGRPKGVMIPHRAVVNYVHAAVENFALTAGDRVLQFASISFDTAAEEIFPTLATGAALVLRTEEMLGSVTAFLTQCAEWSITVLDLPTAYWHEMVEKMTRERAALPHCLRLIILGGERALPDKLGRWLSQVQSNVRLLNTYGPTEATIVATQCELRGESKEAEVPIGRPIANARAYVLDAHEQPVPVGVKGELCLAGAGLARGYLMRPELTAEKFVPEAFGDQPGARLYRTGDRVRRLADGRLQYHGRLDEQVKVRGFRIELGEIETALNQHPAIGEAVVTAKAEESGQARLLAYFAPAHAATVTTTELRRFLLKSLPDYMVPQTFVMLEVLPKTASGKIDRRALPEPESMRPELENAFIAPRTHVEKELAAIWSGVLNLEKIGIHDNFFELGGHSLLAIQIVSRMRAAFNVEVPLRSIFEAPTVEALATLLGKIELAGAEDEAAAKMLAELDELSEEEAAALLKT